VGPEAAERVLDWWASSLDRHAQSRPVAERPAVLRRIVRHMEREVRTQPSSAAAAYWLAAALRGLGQLDRAWQAATAGWVRAPLVSDRGASLRADLDRLVLEAIIPERALLLPEADREQAGSAMREEWERIKRTWIPAGRD
jgi:hypothetical protein